MITAIQKVLKFCNDALNLFKRCPSVSDYQFGYEAAIKEVMAVAIVAQGKDVLKWLDDISAEERERAENLESAELRERADYPDQVEQLEIRIENRGDTNPSYAIFVDGERLATVHGKEGLPDLVLPQINVAYTWRLSDKDGATND